MNAIHTFLSPTYDQILAALRMQQPVISQPRDDAGRFVSPRDITRARLERLTANLTPQAKSEARARATQRGRG